MIRWAEIRRRADAFRGGLEAFDRRGMGYTWPRFPWACCGSASELLGAYFHARRLCTFMVVCGYRDRPDGDEHSHAWLRYGRYSLDITADQFGSEISERVLLARDSRWHRTWTRLETNAVNFDGYLQLLAEGDVPIYARIHAMYEAAAAAADAAG